MKDGNLICKHISLNSRTSTIPYKQIYAFYYSHQDKTPASFSSIQSVLKFAANLKINFPLIFLLDSKQDISITSLNLYLISFHRVYYREWKIYPQSHIQRKSLTYLFTTIFILARLHWMILKN